MPPRHYLRFTDLSPSEIRALFNRAGALKTSRQKRETVATLSGQTLVMIFEKASTRTRLSFEAAMVQLGGHCIELSSATSQLGRGEPLGDTAKVASRYCEVMMMRTFSDDRLYEFAAHATVPVINGLSDGGHPVQVLTDLFTIEERLGPVEKLKVAFVGDTGSNMGRSFVEASAHLQFELRLASPVDYRPDPALLASARVRCTDNVNDAVSHCDVIVTDVFTSMGQEAESAARLKALMPFQVNVEVMKRASPQAIFLHCLPAHRGEEVTTEVLEGPQSAVWDEAENRMHVQKALLEQLLLKT